MFRTRTQSRRFLIVTAMWPTPIRNFKNGTKLTRKNLNSAFVPNRPLFCHKFQLELLLKSIWTWKCRFKVCSWIQKPVHNHRTQHQGFWTSHKSRENQSKETISAGHGIFNIHWAQIFWAKKASRHIKKTNLLTEHLQTRLGHKKPHAVHSVTVLCILNQCCCLRQM